MMESQHGKKLKDKQTCRIFFSSPFGGMEGEREELTRRYFPRIHHLCNSRGIQFVAVDMRWGITTESHSSAQVINICLKELDRSDMFVGFFGQRYGWHGKDDQGLQENFDNAVKSYPWIDKYRDKSITELEFLRGHLNNPGELPAVVCFRDKDYDDMQRDDGLKRGDKKKVFKYSSESALATELLTDLKRRVKETEDKTLGVYMDYKTPTEAAELIFNAIWKHLTEVLLKDTEKESKTVRLLSEHDAFLSSRTLLYVGNEEILQTLTKNLNSEKPEHYFLTGSSGSGKSSILCNWIKQLKSDSSYPNLSIVYHFVGSAEESTNIRSMIILLIAQLESQAGNDIVDIESKYIKMEMSDLVNQITVGLEKLIELGKMPVLIVDGIEKLTKKSKVAKPMYWLPKTLPSEVRVVVSTKSTDTDNIKELIDERKFTQIEVLPLTLPDQKELSEKTLHGSSKDLSANQIARIVDAEKTKNPLFLKILLNELVVFGYFRLLDDKIDSLMSSLSVVELFDKVLQRLEDDYNVKEYAGNLVEQTMCVICLSKNGLSETDLMEMYQIPSHVWSPLYFAIRNFILEQSGLIRFAFTELGEAVIQRYLKNDTQRQQYLKDLIQFFENEKNKLPVVFGENKILESRVSHELPWLYIKAEDYEGLCNVLSNLSVYKVLKRDCMYDLIELWNKTEKKWSEIADIYSKSIDLKLVDYHQWIEDNLLMGIKTVPVMLLDSRILNDLIDLMEYVFALSAVKFAERYVKVVKSCTKAYPDKYDKADQDDAVYDLACQYSTAGRFDEAKELFLEILESQKKRCEEYSSDKNTMRLGRYYHGLAIVHLRLKTFKESEEYFLKSKELQESVPDEFSEDNRRALIQNLGLIYMYNKEFDKAIDYCQQSLKIVEKLSFGHLPESVGQLLTNLGLCYRRQMKLDEAEKIYLRSIEVKINAVGYNTTDVAKTLMNLGTLELHRKNLPKALDYFEKCVKIHETIGNEEWNMEYMFAKENKISGLIRLKRLEDALELYRPWFKIANETKILHMTFPFTHNSMVDHLITKELYDEATYILLGVMDTEKKHPKYFLSLHRIDKETNTKPPLREFKYSLEYGLELFPSNLEIVECLVTSQYLPDQATDQIIQLLESKTSTFGPISLYRSANKWLNETENIDLKYKHEVCLAINQSALRMNSDNSESHGIVGKIYFEEKKYEDALPHFLKLPLNPENLVRIVQSSFHCGEMETCKKHCAIMKEKFSDSTLISEIDQIMQSIGKPEHDANDDESVKKDDKPDEEREETNPVSTENTERVESKDLTSGNLISHQAMTPADSHTSLQKPIAQQPQNPGNGAVPNHSTIPFDDLNIQHQAMTPADNHASLQKPQGPNHPPPPNPENGAIPNHSTIPFDDLNIQHQAMTPADNHTSLQKPIASQPQNPGNGAIPNHSTIPFDDHNIQHQAMTPADNHTSLQKPIAQQPPNPGNGAIPNHSTIPFDDLNIQHQAMTPADNHASLQKPQGPNHPPPPNPENGAIPNHSTIPFDDLNIQHQAMTPADNHVSIPPQPSNPTGDDISNDKPQPGDLAMSHQAVAHANSLERRKNKSKIKK